ncbi:hypothetical protein BDN71DRAFT_1448168 [Pleurotus eryngii]|uniref:Uncharacterized protein n=1 Tax=Pleurotus eryngii TaxID=5323 RepID=A0A9P5ZVH9_PLEER|nr:hypothetical protein BDN71DRAFT_1448168 [Pleurotus eryngii]
MATTTSSGTQSPPLEATGEEKPMGFSSVNSHKEATKVVPDKEQRKAYFPDTADKKEVKPEKAGRSMSEDFSSLIS